MEHYSGSMIDIMDAEFDEAYWIPTPARHLQNMLEVAEYAVREANRTAAWQMAAIASAVEAARQAPEVYVNEVLSGSAHGRDLAVRSVVFDLSVRLKMSATTVRQLADRAERLQSRLPRCWQKIIAGEVLDANTRILSDEILGLAPAHTGAFDATLAEPATRLTPAKLRVKARAVREQLEHASRQERHERSAAERRVYVEDDSDGMAWLCLYAPAADVYRAKARIDAGAAQLHQHEDETRTLAQLRADIAARLFAGAKSFRRTRLAIQRANKHRQPCPALPQQPRPEVRDQDSCRTQRPRHRVLQNPHRSKRQHRPATVLSRKFA